MRKYLSLHVKARPRTLKIMTSRELISKKKKKQVSHPQLYMRWGIMSTPVLGSTIDRKHSSMIDRATASFELHSAFRASLWAEWIFWSSWIHLRSVQEKPLERWLIIPRRELRPKCSCKYQWNLHQNIESG